MRADGRAANELREVSFKTDYIIHPEGSVLVSMGGTKVLCNVSIEDTLPRWLMNEENPHGWVTAEYAMLPRSTHTRISRETLRPRGRTQEISRLIGRSLRQAVNLEQLGERTCTVDCDVLQADGGTRTAAITGGYVALALALKELISKKEIPASVLKTPVAAISVGLLDGAPLLDLCYEEDVKADVDFNLVMDGNNSYIEIQGTAEGVAFPREKLDSLLSLAEKGIKKLLKDQLEILK